MDFSALEREISALEKSSDSLGNWLEFWTGVIVLGLIVEYVPDIIKLVKDLTDKRSFIFRELIEKRSFDWALLREVIGGILITVGVSGELWVGVLASAVETDLRTARGKLTEQLRKDAAQAVQKAAEAESHLEEAKEQTARAEERAAKAEKATEDERIERLKLEKQVAPRRLTKEQQNAISASLKRFKGRNVAVVTYSLDVEAAVLGTQIISTLRQAGIRVEEKLAGLLETGSFALGIHVSGPANEQDLVKALSDLLSHEGKLTTHNLGTKPAVPVGISILRDQAVFILVAVKPPPP